MLHFGLAAAALFALAGCGDDEGAAPGDVIYENGATDEAWISFDETEAIVDDARAPMLTAPTAPIPRATPVTFTWTAGAVARGPRGVRVGEELAALFFGPTAHAHGDPITGPIYRVVIDVPSGEPVRVLTGATTYTPTPTVWERIFPATGPLRIEIAGAYARLNRIEEGPYVGTTAAEVTFE
jgi:hypothetical protein